MKAIIKFTEDSFYYKAGEKERVVENLTEIHFCYKSPLKEKQTAFESDIDGTGFTVFNKYIKEIEITYETNKS